MVYNLRRKKKKDKIQIAIEMFYGLKKKRTEESHRLVSTRYIEECYMVNRVASKLFLNLHLMYFD